MSVCPSFGESGLATVQITTSPGPCTMNSGMADAPYRCMKASYPRPVERRRSAPPAAPPGEPLHDVPSLGDNMGFADSSPPARSATAALLASLAVIACDFPVTGSASGSGGSGETNFSQISCDLPSSFIFDGGVARDAIPSLQNPSLVRASGPGTRYLDDWAAVHAQFPSLPDTRIIGIVVDGQAIAFPHNILWWHEIINVDVGGLKLAVTYCPLTGSSIVFDRKPVGVARFGVSGLVFQNNLMMFDPETESLWPQMSRGARCGTRSGRPLRSVPSVEMRWEQWKALYPNTLVVSSETGWDRNYVAYPYDLYEVGDFLLFPAGELDSRRPVKERVLGIPDGTGGLAIPFGVLEQAGAQVATTVNVGGRSILVLWDADAQAAMAFDAATSEGPATIKVVGGRFVDDETGSVWSVDGRGIEGSRKGQLLNGVDDAYVSFWFAWSLFQP